MGQKLVYTQVLSLRRQISDPTARAVASGRPKRTRLLTYRTPRHETPETPSAAAASSSSYQMAAASPESRPPRSLFDLPADFFDSSSLLGSHPSSAPSAAEPSESIRPAAAPPLSQPSEAPGLRWTCNTCASEFESLQEQREHFKSDLHRLNVYLSAHPPPLLCIRIINCFLLLVLIWVTGWISSDFSRLISQLYFLHNGFSFCSIQDFICYWR